MIEDRQEAKVIAGMQKLFCLNIRQLGCRKFQSESKFLHNENYTKSFVASLEDLSALLPFSIPFHNHKIESGEKNRPNVPESTGNKFILKIKSKYLDFELPGQKQTIGLGNSNNDKVVKELRTADKLNISVKISKEPKDKTKQRHFFEMAEHFPSLVSNSVSVQSKDMDLHISLGEKPPASLEQPKQRELENNSLRKRPLINAKENQEKLDVINFKDNIERNNKESQIGEPKTTKGETVKGDEVSKREENTERVYVSNAMRDNGVVEREKPLPKDSPKVTRVYEIPTKIATIVESAKEYPIKAELVLQPRWLGTVIVEINVVKDRIEIMFKCENKESMQLLESNLVQLREKLQNLGFEKQYFSFEHQNEGGEGFLSSKGERQQKYEEETLRRQFLHSFYRNQEFYGNVIINEWGDNVNQH